MQHTMRDTGHGVYASTDPPDGSGNYDKEKRDKETPVEGFEGFEVVMFELPPPAKRIKTCSKTECLEAVLTVARQQSGAGQGERCANGCNRNASKGNKRCDPCINSKKSHICEICTSGFRCRKYLEDHKKTCRSKKKLGKKFDHFCTTCDVGFKKRAHLERHNLSKKHTKKLEADSKISY